MGDQRFWSDHSIEPKRKFRWIMGFNGIPYWLLKKASRPTISVTEAEHVFLNYKFYFPGRVEFDEMSVTIADPLHPDASATMMDLLKNSGYVTPDLINLQSPKTMTKRAAVEAVGGKLFMAQLDSKGEIVEEWSFWNPWIKSVNFDEADYESDDLINLEVTFRYDWASIVGGTVDPLIKRQGFTRAGTVATQRDGERSKISAVGKRNLGKVVKN
jgi:hypothetical protein